MMVDASEPPLDIHNVYVQLRKVFAFVRRDLGKFRIILLQWLIAIPLIRYNFSVLAYPSFKEWTKRLGRSIVNNLGIRATKAFIDNLKGNDDKAFVLTSSSEHPFLCTANEELVYMDFSRKWIVSRTLHRLLYFPFKFPAGLLTEFIFLGQFFRRHSFLLSADLEGYVESKQNRELAGSRDGSLTHFFVEPLNDSIAYTRESSQLTNPNPIYKSSLKNHITILTLECLNLMDIRKTTKLS